MSGKNIKAKLETSPPVDSGTLGGSSSGAVARLEYTMQCYGERPTNVKSKPNFHEGYLMKFTGQLPIQAVDYLKAKIYSDSDLLRQTILCHSRQWKHDGEDNELF